MIDAYYEARLDPVIGGHARLPVMTIEMGHYVMQSHLECFTSHCALRKQATQRLVEAGHMTLAPWHYGLEATTR